jgi:hypothetical protein
MLSLVVVLGLALASSGCRAAGAFGASPAEHALYRRTKTTPLFEDRIAAARDYLRRYPEGLFVAEVKAFYTEADRAYFEARRESRAGLRAYLALSPEGPHAERARALADALEVREARRAALTAGAELEQRIGKAAGARARVEAEVTRWVRLLARRETFTRRLVDQGDELAVAWGLELPRPSCGERGARGVGEGEVRCRKSFDRAFEVLEDGEPSAREATVELVVVEDRAGRPLEVSLGGPDLFARLAEARSARPVAPTDRETRAKAAREVAELVTRAFLAVGGREPSRCKREPVAPTVLTLACEGVSVVVRPGATPADPDVVLVTPLAE